MCLNCQKDGYNNLFKINGRGWGSKFDLEDITIPLCRNCTKELNVKRKWFKNKRNKEGIYEYEDELEDLIKKIGINKVLLTNKCSNSIIIVQ